MKKLIVLFCLLVVPCFAADAPITTPQGWAFGYRTPHGIVFVPVSSCKLAPKDKNCFSAIDKARGYADKQFKLRKKDQ